jgi:hypothetical protein
MAPTTTRHAAAAATLLLLALAARAGAQPANAQNAANSRPLASEKADPNANCVANKVTVAKPVQPAKKVLEDAFDAVRGRGAPLRRGQARGARPPAPRSQPPPASVLSRAGAPAAAPVRPPRPRPARTRPRPRPAPSAPPPRPPIPARPRPLLPHHQDGVEQHFTSLAEIGDFRPHTSTYSCVDSRGEINTLVGARPMRAGGPRGRRGAAHGGLPGPAAPGPSASPGGAGGRAGSGPRARPAWGLLFHVRCIECSSAGRGPAVGGRRR